MCTSCIICFRACISIISSRPHPGAHLLILHMKRVHMTRLINHHSKHTCWWEYVVASDGPIRQTMQLGKRPGRIVSWEQAGRSWLADFRCSVKLIWITSFGTVAVVCRLLKVEFLWCTVTITCLCTCVKNYRLGIALCIVTLDLGDLMLKTHIGRTQMHRSSTIIYHAVYWWYVLIIRIEVHLDPFVGLSVILTLALLAMQETVQNSSFLVLSRAQRKC